MEYLALVAVLGLATFRLGWLVAQDDFPPSVALRGRISDRFGPHSSWTYLVECPYCASGWLGLALTAGLWAALDGGLPAPPLTWLGSWGLAAVVTLAVELGFKLSKRLE